MTTLNGRLVLVVGGLALSVALSAQTTPSRGRSYSGRAIAAVRHDVSPALRDIPADLREEPDGDRAAHAPLRVPKGRGTMAPRGDGALQEAPMPSLLAAPSVNFDGVNNRNGVLPPDTNGDIGPNHYVQWVNLSFAVYSRTGATLKAPTNGNTIFANFGGPCETTNDGDPIVLYDEAADRWLLSQFALPNYPAGPFYQCIAISTGSDPSLTYHRYEFQISASKLNDYPKFGVWRDGYYMTVNQFAGNSYAGAGVVVFERDKMLAGQTARQIYIDTNDVTLGGMLPSDIDGATLPAAGTPNYVFQFDDDYPVPGDFLEIWEFATNWTTGTAAFTLRDKLAVAAFDSNLCNYARNCIPQPGTSAKLDTLSDRLMYRLQYRNFGTYETFVTNHTVDVNGADRAGIRWYEIRKTGGTFSVRQQSTFSPDATHRWMASAAMDKFGNIGLAYNTSSSTAVPVDPVHRAARRRPAGHDEPGGNRHPRRLRLADQHLEPLGRLQQPQRRSRQRLHVLGDARIHQPGLGAQSRALANAGRGVRARFHLRRRGRRRHGPGGSRHAEGVCEREAGHRARLGRRLDRRDVVQGVPLQQRRHVRSLWRGRHPRHHDRRQRHQLQEHRPDERHDLSLRRAGLQRRRLLRELEHRASHRAIVTPRGPVASTARAAPDASVARALRVSRWRAVRFSGSPSLFPPFEYTPPVSLLYIAAGGALGSVARYLMAGAVHRIAPPFFPYGTFVVNVTGCVVFGLLAGLAFERGMIGPGGRAFLLVGVLGGYTTFSTFGFETFELLRAAKFGAAAANAGGQVLAGVGGVWLGAVLSRVL